jgi:DDE superfamily endonuclease
MECVLYVRDDGTGCGAGAGWREARFAAYLDAITAVLGHASRVGPARAYCTGLLLPGERKSVEPMAARIEPGRVQAAHQSSHHIVAKAEWDDDAVLGAVRERVLPAMERHGPTGRSPTGSWTTPASPSRASTRSAWRGSTAGSWASRTAARWR